MKRQRPDGIELGIEEFAQILDRASSSLGAEDLAKLKAVFDTLALLTRELETKGTTIERLRRLIFGATTENTDRVLGKTGGGSARGLCEKSGKKHKGHGRNGAAAYTGAEQIKIPHESLKHKDACPDCLKGKVYVQSDPEKLVRIKGVAPLAATVYECQKLRCNLCGKVFTAKSPEGVGSEKYDETAASMIGLLKYGTGLPFNRLEKLEGKLGIPLPAATQWDVVHKSAGVLEPAYEELARQAAQGEVIHNDDTTAKILEFTADARKEALPKDANTERTGVFTSGILSVVAGRKIALFFTGAQHAGENLADVLSHREKDRPQPIQMSDGLSRNQPSGHETLAANCLTHARRRYVDVVDRFPVECRFVLEALREVYKNDAVARQRQLSGDERLRFHQAESGPILNRLKEWCSEQIDGRKVEPNSGLGEAIQYMQNRWEKLTLFLRVAGAPLDNNICERVLKKAILHRRNSLFYKTLNGARVGDLFMSLIHTAELCNADPFSYLVALQRHVAAVLLEPAAWMPWNYGEALARLVPEAAPAE